jgi:hypothetical protein
MITKLQARAARLMSLQLILAAVRDGHLVERRIDDEYVLLADDEQFDGELDNYRVKEGVMYRRYLIERGRLLMCVATSDSREPSLCERSPGFVRWVDADWQFEPASV